MLVNDLQALHEPPKAEKAMRIDATWPGHGGRARPCRLYESVCVGAGGMEDAPPVIPGFTPVPLGAGLLRSRIRCWRAQARPQLRRSRAAPIENLITGLEQAQKVRTLKAVGAMKLFALSLVVLGLIIAIPEEANAVAVPLAFIVLAASAAMGRRCSSAACSSLRQSLLLAGWSARLLGGLAMTMERIFATSKRIAAPIRLPALTIPAIRRPTRTTSRR